MNWLKSSAHCPAGCGHLCEYTWAHHDYCSHSWCSVGVGIGPHTGLDHTHKHTHTPQTDEMSSFLHMGLESFVSVGRRTTLCVCECLIDWVWRRRRFLCALLDSHSGANTIMCEFIFVFELVYISRCYDRCSKNITIFFVNSHLLHFTLFLNPSVKSWRLYRKNCLLNLSELMFVHSA